MSKTWIGVRCPDCSEVAPVLSADRELHEGDWISIHERREISRVGREGVKCPWCGSNLREGIPVPSGPPPDLDVRP